MHGFVLSSFEAPPELIDVPVPVPSPDEVLIRVLASSVNPVDLMIMSGFFRTMQEYRLPAVLGRDVCGVVVEVGADVTELHIGQLVWGFVKREHIGDGTFAEFVTSPANRFVVALPEGMAPASAGALGLSSVTALECLDAIAPRSGSTVLIVGATGGVGSCAVQLAVQAGCQVIAAVRNDEQGDYVRTLGAHLVVDRTLDDLAEQVRALAPGGVDAILDLARPTAGPGGRDADRQTFGGLIDSVLSPDGRVASVSNRAELARSAGRVGVDVHSTPTRESLGRIASLAGDGHLRVPIAASFAFADIAQAFETLRTGVLGKISVVMSATAN